MKRNVNSLPFKPMQGVGIHVQPTGGVIATARLHDGRVIRVCGEKEYRGCKVSEEIAKWMKWEVAKKDVLPSECLCPLIDPADRPCLVCEAIQHLNRR